MTASLTLFITCPKGVEGLLQDELTQLGATTCKQTVGGVHCEATLETMYRICLWSRLANRVLLVLIKGPVRDSNSIYQLCSDVDWGALFEQGSTLAVSFTGQSNYIRNTMYGAQLVKDAIVDSLRKSWQKRCDIDPKDPDCRVQVRLHHGELSVYYDLSGHSLHQRGYRKQAGAAPIKENLACALLIRAGWSAMFTSHPALIDPCCGSATLLIEAAMMASDKAPGLDRFDFGFLFWQGHDAPLWQKLQTQALERHEKALDEPLPLFFGYDQDEQVLAHAERNVHAAGFDDIIVLEQRPVSEFEMPEACRDRNGLIVTNPPYGERLDEMQDLIVLYQELGVAMSQHAVNWHAAVFTNNASLAKSIGLRSHKQYALFNGAMPCQLYLFNLHPENRSSISTVSTGSEAVINRLKKNSRKLKAWRRQNDIEAYRIYDADIPEYACAIDVYKEWVVVQEYKAPSDIPVAKTLRRLAEVIQAIPLALEVPSERVILKQRAKQKGKQQYERQADSRHELVVKEGPAKFIVNLKDYLDTGLFLDHRLIRRHIYETARGKTVLNLFCYTGSLSVYAALGGARTTVNVDMSRTYLEWAKDNFRLNYLTIRDQQFIPANCMAWIGECTEKFDIIFLDPPSFSNSKRMEGTLDVQRDHVSLIVDSMKLLKPDGTLYFSTNYRKFKLSQEIVDQYNVEDITAKTIDKDFARRKNIHACFVVRLPSAGDP